MGASGSFSEHICAGVHPAVDALFLFAAHNICAVGFCLAGWHFSPPSPKLLWLLTRLFTKLQIYIPSAFSRPICGTVKMSLASIVKG